MIPDQIADALSTGAQIVTATQRAARELRLAYDTRKLATGFRVWEPANVLALDSWLVAQWQRLVLDGVTGRALLNRTQELHLWREIVRLESTEDASSSLADTAMQAFARLLLHTGRSRLDGSATSTDTIAFRRWADAFDLRCEAEGWLSVAWLPAEIERAAQRGHLRLPPAGILLAGFDRLPPAHQKLFAALHRAGCPVENAQPAELAGEKLSVAASDESAELNLAARWIGERLQRQPRSRIALIVPGLEARRAAIARTLHELLAPTADFEFSLGIPLASTPLAAAALDLLRWPLHPLPLETVSSLLLSPFFGASLNAGERASLAEFDAFDLRRLPLLRPEVTLDRIVDHLEASSHRAALADLLARLRAVRLVASERNFVADTGQTHAGWADTFRALLQAARWNRRIGDHTLTHQAAQAWESALDQLSTLDFDGTRVLASTALAELQEIASTTIFAPESRGAPLQIMGPLEAAGCRFDALWMLGAGDLSWPLPSTPNPLLPWRLQRELSMPEANPVLVREQAAGIVHRLAASAPIAIFSFARVTADGAQELSPTLAELDLRPCEPHLVCSPPPLRLAPRMEIVPDNLDLPALPNRPAHGGAQILQNQAACPFRAFATHRLRSARLETRQPGLDDRDRGNDVHAILEAFWRDTKDQAQLRSMTPAQRSGLLRRCIEEALGRRSRLSEISWDHAYLEVQQERLSTLIDRWLHLEKIRPEFAVKELESTRDIFIGPLHLKLKCDRIDATASGALILDYKTGAVDSTQWLGERPDSPQLPLYAVLSDPDELAGVAFAEVRSGKDLKLSGYARDGDVLLGKKNKGEFGTQVDEWRGIILRLATDFSLGASVVDPKKYPLTCKHCDQRMLCRLDPSRVTEEEADETNDEDIGV